MRENETAEKSLDEKLREVYTKLRLEQERWKAIGIPHPETVQIDQFLAKNMIETLVQFVSERLCEDPREFELALKTRILEAMREIRLTTTRMRSPSSAQPSSSSPQ